MKKLITGLLVFGLTTQFTISNTIGLAEANQATKEVYLDSLNPDGVNKPNIFLEDIEITIGLMEAILNNVDDNLFNISTASPVERAIKLHTTEVELLHTDEKIKKVIFQKKKMLYNEVLRASNGINFRYVQ